MSLLIEESKIRSYFLKMSFPESLFGVIAFACNAKSFVTFLYTFRKVSEGASKY